MRGTTWNGNFFAPRGMCSSDGKGMFSVGGLIAFQTVSHSSPDGKQYHYGCDLSSAGYSLQDEIVLEEFDRTEASEFGSGSYDVQSVVELHDIFRHEKSSSERGTKQFLCSILEHGDRLLPQEIASARIEEVRNHPGKFLHVYEVGDGPFKLSEKATSFEEAIAAIIAAADSVNTEMERLEKAAAEKHAQGQSFSEEGIQLAILRAKKTYGQDSHWSDRHKEGKVAQLQALLANIEALNKGEAIAFVSRGAYYSQPSNMLITNDADIPILGLGSDDHFGRAVRDQDLIIQKIVKKVKLGFGRLYCGSFLSSTLIDIFQSDGELSYNNNLVTEGNSQKWEENVSDYSFTRFYISTGEEGKMKEYNERAKKYNEFVAKEKIEREERFRVLSQQIIARFGQETLGCILKEKGGVLILMDAIIASPTLIKEDIQLALKAGHKQPGPILLILIKILADRPNQAKVRRIVSKAFAWDYLKNAGLDYRSGGYGYFNDTLTALKIYGSMELSEKASAKSV